MAGLRALILICALQLLALTQGFSAYEGMQCPVAESKANLNIRNFMGLWYILEYQYPREMAVADLSCLSFRFREAEEGIVGNFTFKFPPRNGHFYHLPTFSNIVATGQDGLWMTEFKGATLLTSIVETDYSGWAVFVQCEEEGAGNKFLSTRVLARRPQLSPAEWLQVREVIQAGGLEADFRYTIDQENC